jgi:hypothetical protein
MVFHEFRCSRTVCVSSLKADHHHDTSLVQKLKNFSPLALQVFYLISPLFGCVTLFDHICALGGGVNLEISTIISYFNLRITILKIRFVLWNLFFKKLNRVSLNLIALY